MTHPDPMLTVRDLAVVLNAPPRTVARLCASGRIRAVNLTDLVDRALASWMVDNEAEMPRLSDQRGVCRLLHGLYSHCVAIILEAAGERVNGRAKGRRPKLLTTTRKGR